MVPTSTYNSDGYSGFEEVTIADWSSFLSVQAEAAATLTGLIFVAMSINAERVMTFPGLPSRAGEAVLQFLQVF